MDEINKMKYKEFGFIVGSLPVVSVTIDRIFKNGGCASSPSVSVLGTSTEGQRKTGRSGAVIFRTIHNFANRKAKITVPMCNKLNRTQLDCLVETRL